MRENPMHTAQEMYVYCICRTASIYIHIMDTHIYVYIAHEKRIRVYIYSLSIRNEKIKWRLATPQQCWISPRNSNWIDGSVETIEFALNSMSFLLRKGKNVKRLWMISFASDTLTMYCKNCKKNFHRMHFALVYSYMEQKTNDSRLLFFFIPFQTTKYKSLLISRLPADAFSCEFI